MPDAFSPHPVRYHKSCWEKKESSNNTIKLCSTCQNPIYGSFCQMCMVMDNHRRANGNNGNSDDNQERERERESKIHLQETNALIVASLLTPKASVTLVHV